MEILSDKIEKLKEQELERLRELLQPHFKEHGDVVIKNNFIVIEYYNGDKCDNIVKINIMNTFDNNYSLVYKKTGVDISEVFEEMGEILKEIKVKPVNDLHSELHYLHDKLNSNSYADIYNYFKNTKTDEQVQWLVEKITSEPMRLTSKDSCFNSLISYHTEMCIQDRLT